MEKVNLLGSVADQVPESIRDQFQVKVVSDPFLLRVNILFRHSSGTTIETSLYPVMADNTLQPDPRVPDDIIARLCTIAS